MHTTKYLIVGAGMTGDMAAKGIRDHDPDGSITMVGADPNPPYKRPLLTKGLWQGAPEEKLWREPADGVELVTGRRIVSLDLAAHTATDDAGEEYGWEKLLLATGAKPREIPGRRGVIWYRTLDDYRHAREIAGEGSHVVVIGGGFIGSELAAGLVGNGVRVTMLFPEPGIGHPPLPRRALGSPSPTTTARRASTCAPASWSPSASGDRVETESGLDARGRCGRRRARASSPTPSSPRPRGSRSTTGSSWTSTGACPGTTTSSPPATSRASRSPRSASRCGSSTRITRTATASAVGANMAGADAPYDHLPFFYSDLFDLGYEAVGLVDSRLEAVEDWQEPNRKGVVTYVEDGRPRGVLLWNVWDKLDDARDLIRAGEGALAV